VSRARDFLERFRPAGTPGAAAAAGVPADRVAELETELAPVFDALACTEAEADRIRCAASAEAARRRERARQRARAIIAGAGEQAKVDRAAALADARRTADTRSADILAAARRSADLLARDYDSRRADDVAQIVALVRGYLEEEL
jgi:vacuolar-type H+-ATPase subunit H